MAFDGITCKAVANEINNLSGALVDKIYQPTKNSVVIGLYNHGKNYVLNCVIDANNYRVNLTKSARPNPQVAPNFCMVLRKHLTRLRLKNVYTMDLERVVFIEFEGFNEFDEIINMKLIVELMGRHSNIILVDETGLIVDSLRHIKDSGNTYRNILPHCKYVFPATDKLNFYDIKDASEFEALVGEAAQVPTKVNRGREGLCSKLRDY